MNSLETDHVVAVPPAPRSLPGPSHTAAPAEPERSRFWMIAVACTVLLAIVGGVLLTVLLHSFADAKPPAVAASTPDTNRPPIPRAVPVPLEANRPANVNTAPAPLEANRPANANALPAPLEANRPANASDVKDRSLETIGSLTAANLYQGFLNIGLLADARESEIYSLAEAEKLLDSVSRMLDTVDRRLARMLDDGLKDEDREAVEHARQLSGQLRTQARELRAYWKTGDKEHADKFQKARQQSWSGIQTVLGIED
jgi:hypothetical protein